MKNIKSKNMFWYVFLLLLSCAAIIPSVPVQFKYIFDAIVILYAVMGIAKEIDKNKEKK